MCPIDLLHVVSVVMRGMHVLNLTDARIVLCVVVVVVVLSSRVRECFGLPLIVLLALFVVVCCV